VGRGGRTPTPHKDRVNKMQRSISQSIILPFLEAEIIRSEGSFIDFLCQNEMATYTNEEYYDMLMALGECHGQHHAAARTYVELYPNRERHPSAPVILGAAQRLHETGSVLPNKHDTGRNRAARNLRNTETVIRAVEQNPETSVRTIAREYGLSYSAVRRILKEKKLHAFHYTRVQHLQPEDYPQRKTFCKHFLREADQDSRFPSRVIFSDESLFTREGME